MTDHPPCDRSYSPEVEDLVLWIVGSCNRFYGKPGTWEEAERAGLIEKGPQGPFVVTEKGRALLRRRAESIETWRDEMYGDEGGTDPFWVPLEASDGHDRDPIEAADLVKGFVGAESFDTGLSVELVRGRMESMGPDGWFFHKDADGDIVCWEVCCS